MAFRIRSNAGVLFDGFAIDQEPSRQNCHLMQMATFVFRCPNKNLRVQSWTDDPPDDDSTYAPVQCVACRHMHYVNPATGRVLGITDDDE